jgi:hypothetical protein
MTAKDINREVGMCKRKLLEELVFEWSVDGIPETPPARQCIVYVL